METNKWIIEEEQVGTRLDKFLLEQMPDDISNMELFKDKIVGYIIHATVDEVNFCLDIHKLEWLLQSSSFH